MKTLSLLSTRMYCAVAARRQKGATMVEYVLLAALIGVAVAVILNTLGVEMDARFDFICEKVKGTACAGA
ncbi:MAG: Flp family type IVb pilin [Comamonadaceae bacterium PBBC1]|nr:MAG: Flp family type IVb pilin [Comamonadaceae bacterium PBBC1]